MILVKHHELGCVVSNDKASARWHPSVHPPDAGKRANCFTPLATTVSPGDVLLELCSDNCWASGRTRMLTSSAVSGPPSREQIAGGQEPFVPHRPPPLDG